MSTDNAVATWAERRTERKAERWAARAEDMSTRLPTWRTEHRVRLLIGIYCWSLVAGLATAVTQVFWTPALFAWVPFTLALCVSWTMLRTVINTRDAAPETELDEYESRILRTWQVAAYGWTTAILFTVSMFMIFVAVIAPDSLDRWVYTAGLLCVLGMLSATAVPTIAYATTFGPVPPPNN
jgi:lipopolysaccharide export LptBFGC system permease protein LptF